MLAALYADPVDTGWCIVGGDVIPPAWVGTQGDDGAAVGDEGGNDNTARETGEERA
jgi:hypothetical protein